MNSSHAGGAAMAGGQRFQARVTAWWAARILLQTRAVGQVFNLSPLSIAERLYCETTDSTDDIRIEFTQGEKIFGQCKTSLSLSILLDSQWASVLLQFYNEWHKDPNSSIERRFVLFYESPNNNLVNLAKILKRYRQLSIDTPLIAAAMNDTERSIAENLNSLLASLNPQSTTTEKAQLLHLCYLKQLRLGEGEPDSLGVVDALQEGLLVDPEQINTVLKSLHCLADDLIAERGSQDRMLLRQRLQKEHIILRDSIDYRLDFKRLDDWTTTAIKTHDAEGRAKLSSGESSISVFRPVVQAMLDIDRDTSFLVIGGAGTGKTGCLLTLAKHLRDEGERVWYWAADALAYRSLQEIGTHLQLQHPWAGLFAEAASGSKTTLIIDGLDGLRDAQSQRAYRNLFSLAICSGVRVVASIRSFDLQYSYRLQDIFSRNLRITNGRYQNEQFKDVAHIIIPELEDKELDDITSKIPSIETIIKEIPQLRSVIRNLFSLSLLCRLISNGETTENLSPLSTQAELFERFWARRVLDNEYRNELIETMTQIIEQMVGQKALQVIPKKLSGQTKDILFSLEFIRHPPTIPGRLPSQELIEFTHHLLFDYAAELLFVRSQRKRLASELSDSATWGLFLRPSLVLFHRYSWHHARIDFWETLLELEQASVSVLQKLPSYLVVAEEARNIGDLSPMQEGCFEDNNYNYWIQIMRGVISAATYSSLPKLFNSASGDWWIDLAYNLISSNSSDLVYAGRRILFTAADTLNNLSSLSCLFLNRAAISLVKYHWNESIQTGDFIRPAIGWVCHTMAFDLISSSEIIRRIISEDELRRVGYIQATEVANNIECVWKEDSGLAVEVYKAIFGYTETDRSSTPMGGLILTMISNRRQDYEMAYYLLSEKFSGFLKDFPVEATQALIHVIRYYEYDKYKDFLLNKPKNSEKFIWDGRECQIQSSYSHISVEDREYIDNQIKMLHLWRDYLKSLPGQKQGEGIWGSLSNVLANENELVAIWKTILLVSICNTGFYARNLWTILINPVILAKPDIRYAVMSCIEHFASYLSDEQIANIESAILNIRQDLFKGSSRIDIENYLLELKIKLLVKIPEDKRGTITREFLHKYAHELRDNDQDGISTNEEDNDWTGWRKSNSPLDYEQTSDFSKHLEEISEESIDDQNVSRILEDIRAIKNKLVELSQSLESQSKLIISERLVFAYSKIACSKANLNKDEKNELFEVFKAILTSPTQASFERDTDDDHSTVSWSPLDMYVNASIGLLCLTKKSDDLSEEYKELLFHVSQHPKYIVRFHLGIRIWGLLKSWPEFVWGTLERWIKELPEQKDNHNVLTGTLRDSWFWWLRKNDRRRTNQLLRDLLYSARSYNSRPLRRSCGSWLAVLYFSKGEAWARNILSNAVNSMIDFADELDGAFNVAIDLLLPRDWENSSKPRLQERALTFLVDFLSTANQILEAYRIEIARIPEANKPSEPPEIIKQIAGQFQHISMNFRFSAENYVTWWNLNHRGAKTGQETNWWITIEPILDAILNMPHPAIAFHIIEGLEYFVDLDLERCIHWLRRVTLASGPSGLTSETLASNHTIGILEKVLAEHRVSLADQSELLSDFIHILEAYLQVGWPRAMRLAVQVESIFR